MSINWERYLVGGAVRDQLSGKKQVDRDYLVLNTSAEDLIRDGFIPVGNSFTVFLHPQTREEYALPRGDNLKDDLFARDLTINAMAVDEAGNLIDPFGGERDLANKILRHVSPHFLDDPLRVFRVARFKAAFPDFTIADETKEIIQEAIKRPEFKNINTERIFKELKQALKTEMPSLFFETLREMNALNPYFLELQKLMGVPQAPKYHPEGDAWVHTMLVLDQAAGLSDDLRVRYAALVHDLGKGETPEKVLPRHIGHEDRGLPLVKSFGERMHVPNDWTEAALVVTRFHLRVHRLNEMKASSMVRMFYEMDAFRKPHLVTILARACEADEMGKEKEDSPQGALLEKYFEHIKDVSAKDVDPGLTGKAIGEEVRAVRVRRLNQLLRSPIKTGD